MKIPTICENETYSYTSCGYWKYQLITRKNLQKSNQNYAYCGYWQYQQIAIKKLQNHAYCGYWIYDNRKEIQNEVQIAVQMSQIYKVR